MTGIGARLNRNNNHTIMTALLAGLICLLVYLRAIYGDFVNYDDYQYVVDNPGIRLLDWQFVKEALTTSYMGWWMPLTWISFAIDYHFWGLNPFGYHLVNILLHAANTALVVLVADGLLRVEGRGMRDTADERQVTKDERGLLRVEGRGMRGERQTFSTLITQHSSCFILLLAALLWGIHPLRVESVAWVTERKDVLNGIFSLSAIIFYLRYVRMKTAAGYSGAAISTYLLSLFFLLLSLMSKPVSVVIPAMLLLADWYPLQRFQKERPLHIVIEKIPFVILVAAISLATMYFAAGNQILVSYDDLNLYKRFIMAGNAIFEYCLMSLYPVGIIHIYILPWPFPAAYTVKTIIVVIFTVFCFWRYKKNPWLTVTWLAFLLPLLPVLGFFQNGSQSHAARFTYLPAIAPSICAAALFAACHVYISQRYPGYSRFFSGAIVSLLILYGAITLIHIAAWKNPETLWSRAIAIRPIGRVYYLRADYFLKEKRYLEAADDLQKSIDYGKKAGFTLQYNLHAMRGDALNKAGRYEEAAQEFTNAINLAPFPEYFYHRGLALESLGRMQEAELDFSRAGNQRGKIEWRGSK